MGLTNDPYIWFCAIISFILIAIGLYRGKKKEEEERRREERLRKLERYHRENEKKE